MNFHFLATVQNGRGKDNTRFATVDVKVKLIQDDIPLLAEEGNVPYSTTPSLLGGKFLQADEILVRFTPADNLISFARHQDLYDAGPRIVIR